MKKKCKYLNEIIPISALSKQLPFKQIAKELDEKCCHQLGRVKYSTTQ